MALGFSKHCKGRFVAIPGSLIDDMREQPLTVLFRVIPRPMIVTAENSK